MKIFGIKRILGLAAIYGAVQYAKKNGGARNAFNGLLDKAKELAGKVKDEVGQVASQSHSGDLSTASSGSPVRQPSEYSSTSGYGSGGFGGGTNRGGSY